MDDMGLSKDDKNNVQTKSCPDCVAACKILRCLDVKTEEDLQVSSSTIATLHSCKELLDTLLMFVEDCKCQKTDVCVLNGPKCIERCSTVCLIREHRDVAVSSMSIAIVNKDKKMSETKIENAAEDIKTLPVTAEEPIQERIEPPKRRRKCCKCKCKSCAKRRRAKDIDNKLCSKSNDGKELDKPDKSKNLCKCPPIIIFDKPPTKRNFFEFFKCLLPGESVHLKSCNNGRSCKPSTGEASTDSNFSIETLNYSNKDDLSLSNSRVQEKGHPSGVSSNNYDFCNNLQDPKEQQDSFFYDNCSFRCPLRNRPEEEKKVNFLFYETVMRPSEEFSQMIKYQGYGKFMKSRIQTKKQKDRFKVDSTQSDSSCVFRDFDKLNSLRIKCRNMRSYSEFEHPQYDLKVIFDKFKDYKRKEEQHYCFRRRISSKTEFKNSFARTKSTRINQLRMFLVLLLSDFNIKLFIISYLLFLTYFVTSINFV